MAGIAGSSINIIINGIDNFSRTFTKAKVGLARFKGAAIGAIAVGGALAAGLGAAVRASNEVETGYAKVNTLLDKGQDAQKLYGDFVAKTNVVMGNQGDQLDVLSGLYQTISAGITDTAEAQQFMAAASKAAVGGSAELPSVILAGTKAMAAFGLESKDTEHVFDLFAGTVKAGQTTMGELANAFPTVAGMAGQAGLSIEETLGIFAGLTKVLGSSDETATSLSATIRGFIKPTTDMTKAAQELGFESATTMIKEKGLNESLKMLNKYTNGDTQAMAKLFPNIRALKAVFPLLGKAADDVSSSLDILTNSTGLSQKQFEDMTETTQYKWGAATSELKNAIIDLGDSFKVTLLPIMDILIDKIKKLTNWWGGLNDKTKIVITKIVGLTAGLLILVGVITLLATVLTPISLIVVGIIIAITELIAIFSLLKNHWQEFVIGIKKIGYELVDFYIIIGQSIKKAFIIAFAGIKNFIFKIFDSIVEGIENKINFIIRIINTLIRGMNHIPGINIGEIGKVNLSGVKAQMIDINALRQKMDVEQQQALEYSHAAFQKSIQVNIENLNATDAESVATTLQDVIKDKISI